MTSRSIKQKLMRAKISLSQTIQKILDINRKRKFLGAFRSARQEKEEALNEELRVLNKLAEQQALLVRRYENALDKRESPPPLG